MTSPFDIIIKEQGFVILDGALATELEAKGANLNHALWSAKLIAENPMLIQQVHDSYLHAGANVITTSSYQASFLGFEKQGYTKQEATNFMQLSVSLAIETRAHYVKALPKPPSIFPLVAASIGPYGAALSDGSEYRGYQNVTIETLKSFHEERLVVLSKTQADILAFETIPCLEEAIAITDLLKKYPLKQAWISFSCKDGFHLSNGDRFEDALRLLNSANQIIGIGVNCTAPEHILSLIKIAKPLTTKHLLVYPNKGETYNPIDKIWEPTKNCSLGFMDNAKLWLSAGASAIGGCCRTNPADIAQLKQLIIQ